MKQLVILGHGSGGTMVAAKIRKELEEAEWQITVIDRDWQHHYQAGWLFVPFGIYTLEDCRKPKSDFVPKGVNLVMDEVTEIDPVHKKIKTRKSRYPNDWLVIATGCRSCPMRWRACGRAGGKTSTTSTPRTAPRPYTKSGNTSTRAGLCWTLRRCPSSAR